MAGKKEYAHFQIKIHHFEAGVVLKQILSMFLSINDEGFASNNPDLRTYVADPLSTALPPKYRVFTYLNTHGQFRHLPIQASGNLLSGETIVASEIAFPPLGFVLTLDYSGKLSLLQEITHFKQASKGQFATAEVHLNRLETHLPFILDYREKHVIEAAMKSSS
ncbi:MAG: hypothetical protein EOP50_01025 [Sphingobacteriales bacterium]|nr:MAG: hypothetical protein EOP50_01025 [Sphingobacteriales bacterium]